MKKILIFTLSFLAMSSLVFAVDENPCGNFKNEIPADWIQGTIQVPEDFDNEAGTKINVFYYGKILKDKTPVVFFNGGPGQHSHDAFYNISKAQKIFDASKNLSFIFIDQRGTGCSDFYPQGSSPATLQRLAHYGSREIVMDSEAIRKKIYGNKPWIVFGQSYGAHIVHRYVTLYPKSVKAAFSHGNTLNSSGYDRLRYRIASQVRVMDEYLKIYPADIKAVGVLTQNLDLDVCVKWGEKKDKKACGWEISEDFVSSFLALSTNWSKMHQWLNAIVDDDKLNMANLQNYVETWFEEPSEKYSKKWAERVISWIDRNTAPYDKRNCNGVQYELFNSLDVDISTNAFTECSSILQDPDSGLDNWGRQQVAFIPQDLLTIDDLKDALKANPQLPFYLYSGQRDAFVPVESFQEELSALQGLPNLFYKNFPSSGHEGYQTEGEIWKAMIKAAIN